MVYLPVFRSESVCTDTWAIRKTSPFLGTFSLPGDCIIFLTLNVSPFVFFHSCLPKTAILAPPCFRDVDYKARWSVTYLVTFKNIIILTTSAVSSTNLGSILIFTSCVLHRSPVFNKFHESGRNIFVSTNE